MSEGVTISIDEYRKLSAALIADSLRWGKALGFREAIEAAAKVAEKDGRMRAGSLQADATERIAQAIRALSPSPAS